MLNLLHIHHYFQTSTRKNPFSDIIFRRSKRVHQNTLPCIRNSNLINFPIPLEPLFCRFCFAPLGELCTLGCIRLHIWTMLRGEDRERERERERERKKREGACERLQQGVITYSLAHTMHHHPLIQRLETACWLRLATVSQSTQILWVDLTQVN